MKESIEPIHYNCAFCGRSQHEVKSIVAGTYANICNECVAHCVDILVKGETEQPNQGDNNEPC